MVCIDVIFDRNCESGEIIWGQFGNEWTFHFLFHFEGMAVGHEMFRIHNFDKYSWYYFDPAWLKLELPKSRKVASPLHSIFDQFPQVKTFGIYNAPNNEILIQNTKCAETKSWPGPFVHCYHRGTFFVWRAPIVRWPRIMCSQVRMLKFLEPSREML